MWQITHLPVILQQMRRSFLRGFLCTLALLAATNLLAESFISLRRYEVGVPPQFQIVVRPAEESETIGKGIDAPAWMGILEIGVPGDQRRRILYTSELTPGLEFSTASLITDMLPQAQCLWIVTKTHGWSSPHTTTLDGKLFRIDGEKLTSIWESTLLEKTSGAGEGNRLTRDVQFSSSAANGATPTIEVTTNVWAETQQELEHLPARPKRTSREVFRFNGTKFVLGDIELMRAAAIVHEVLGRAGIRELGIAGSFGLTVYVPESDLSRARDLVAQAVQKDGIRLTVKIEGRGPSDAH